MAYGKKHQGASSGSSAFKRLLMSSISYRELEPRIAFDAAVAATTADVFSDQSTDTSSGFSTDTVPQSASTDNATLTEAMAGTVEASGASSEIAFVDSSVADLADLIASFDPSMEIVLLDSNRDGVEQIAEVLAERSGIEAVHIVSHGSQAELNLGTAKLNQSTITGEYADELATISAALTGTADILIYGCNFGEGSEGLQAAQSLAEATGADIAASDDATGHEDLGGDWTLETEIGSIETNVALSVLDQQIWYGVLATVVVDTTSDANDSGATDGNLSHDITWLNANKGGDGKISLREAIIAANNTAGLDTIEFDIADPLVSGAHTIVVTAQFDVTDGVIIDGTSDSDFAGTPIIELDGSGGANDAFRLVTGSTGSTIRGLVINRFGSDAIHIEAGSDGNTIVGNYLGTDVTGTIGLGNGADGVKIQGSNNTIGGIDAADRNIISGNTDGIQIDGASATDNVVIGNYIGTDVTGTVAIANSDEGVSIEQGAANNFIGGTAAGAGNIISGNGDIGIKIRDLGSDANVIQGNLIGTDVTGNVALANTTHGIRISTDAAGNIVGGTDPSARNVVSANLGEGISISGSSDNIIEGNYIGVGLDGATALGNGDKGIEITISSANNRIGGTATGAGNKIANSVNDGIALTSTAGTGNTILGNEIYNNAGIGIDIAPGGVTANDVGDTDTGPNSLQNYPVLTGAFTDGAGEVVVAGYLNSASATAYRIEYFANSGGGSQGEIYLGFQNVIVEASGNATVLAAFDAVVPTGYTITATATNLSTGDTSEFSATVATADALIVDTTNDTLDGDTSSVGNLIASKGADGFISLREAIIATNNTAGHQGIYLSAGIYTMTLPGVAEEFAATGDLDIRDELTIYGEDKSTTTIDGGGLDRVLHLQNGASAYVAGVTVSGGNDSGGAGIRLAGSTLLEMADVIVTGNISPGIGGGIYNAGTIYLNNVEISSNQGTDGGGIYNMETAYISNSLISSNTASGAGGGIWSASTAGPGSTLTVTNSTISGNTAATDGGGAYIDSLATLTHVTVADNTATAGVGGGIVNVGGPGALTIGSTIIASNTSGSGGPDLDGPLTSAGYNIIGDTTGNAGWVGTDQQNTDPLLAALADNGGATQTHALQAGSPAQGAADPSSTIAIDQRGVTRDGVYDVGAFEGTLVTSSDLVGSATSEGGLSLNQDGGNDAYLLADDGGAILGSLATLTVEVQFSSTDFSADSTFISYRAPGDIGADDDSFTLKTLTNGDLQLRVDGASASSSAIDYRTLADGNRHSLAVTWDNAAGAWEIFVDGASIDSGTGLATGQTIEGSGTLVIGQEQDSVGGTFDASEALKATLFDVRIFDDLRSALEISTNYQSSLPYDEPNLVANWHFDDLATDTSGTQTITEEVSGNDLTVSNVGAGGSFVSSSPELTFVVSEIATNGTVVGSVAGIDAERNALIAALLAADSDLIYNPETGKFYKAYFTATDLGHRPDQRHRLDTQ